MAMRIAITNDDGIQGEGLLRLVQWASKLGEVTVYAPKVEQSAKSHAIEIREAFEVREAEIPGAVYCETLPEVTAYLKEIAQPGDVILTVGAGDIYRAGEALFK